MRCTQKFYCSITLVAVLGAATGCSNQPVPVATTDTTGFAWPSSLVPFGDGYPKRGDACRRLGESAKTSPYLDHKHTLVGCPGTADSESAQALVRDVHASIVGKVEGVTLISIPIEGR